ncbi:uncharacterized protein GGS22DRAFT_196844 [Annulohypoxylon maeteangense]|uniref:uncharacterized protein n=1 Tax=Annulohypoxylon maeteangense TaxID=1927788 RepID=UPI00200836F1|nr:uncharacterized protein GGS22DRAFT_196844 [Annulohypoxylon maeteangense]KAI0889211.1 hypothetical protein GGS22DRAFT_196844 [Annulohypoxylon maeteangense]
METESPSDLPTILGSRACTNCARVKCKCIYRTDGATCERCHRLKKQCIPSAPVRRRTARRRGASRTARLEERLDELVSRLKAQQGIGDKETENTSNQLGEQDQHEPDTGISIASSTPAAATNSLEGMTLIGAGSPPDSSVSYLDEPSPSEAEDLLKKFRQETIASQLYLGFFPFINIHMTSQQLRELYPFLWLNIMCIAQTSPKERLSLGDQARSIAIQKVVVDREKSLDLLLGLLAFRYRRDKPYWTLFSQLIVTLVCDLGLHMPQPESTPLLCFLGKETDSRITNLFRTPTREVQRAVLGAFFLTSRISNIFKHAPGLRWSSHLDGYLSNLAQESPMPQDETLIALVRMQLIINQIYDDSQASGGASPPTLYISALRSQLHEIIKRENLSAVARNHPITLELYHFTELLINETAIIKPPTPWNEPDIRRFQVYQACLTSIQAYFDTFFSMPFSLLESVPFTCYPQVVRVMKSLHRLTTIQDPAWDRAAVRRSIDLISTCDKIIAMLEYLKASSTLASRDGSEDESHNRGLVVFRKLKEVWQNDLELMDAESTKGREDTIPNNAPSSEFASSTVFMGDPWFSNIWNEVWE